jgi:hypothetical protein
MYPRSQRFSILPNQGAGIIIKLDHHSILPLHLLRAPHNNSVFDFPSLHFIQRGRRVRRPAFHERTGFLHDNDDAITLQAVSTPLPVTSLPYFQAGIPIWAFLFFTRSFATHSTRVAPELSMQFSIVCISGKISAFFAARVF